MSKTLTITKINSKRNGIKYRVKEGIIIQETSGGYLIRKGNKKEFINRSAIHTGDIEVKVG